jgi:hypothetical protein
LDGVEAVEQLSALSRKLLATTVPTEEMTIAELFETESWELLFLASRCESAGVRQRESQEFVGIDWSVVNADFVVQVGTGAATA